MLLAAAWARRKENTMPDPIKMLREDHQKVKDLFEQFEQSDDEETKDEIAQTAIQELTVHATLEEEIFYPAAQEVIDQDDLIEEAQEEHHVVKLIMNELKKMSAGDERFDAKFKVMAESVKHHIEEEESELFPMLQGKLDSEQLGQQLESRKQRLQQGASRSTGRTSMKRAAAGGKSKSASGKARKTQSASKKKKKKSSGGRR
jgi:hemerythrin-like domain-containing protein